MAIIFCKMNSQFHGIVGFLRGNQTALVTGQTGHLQEGDPREDDFLAAFQVKVVDDLPEHLLSDRGSGLRIGNHENVSVSNLEILNLFRPILVLFGHQGVAGANVGQIDHAGGAAGPDLGPFGLFLVAQGLEGEFGGHFRVSGVKRIKCAKPSDDQLLYQLIRDLDTCALVNTFSASYNGGTLLVTSTDDI